MKFKKLSIGVKNNEIYKYIGRNFYKNLSSGKSGFIKFEITKRLLQTNDKINTMAEINPNIIDLIEKCQLSLEQNIE